jgi:hypothetical protein
VGGSETDMNASGEDKISVKFYIFLRLARINEFPETILPC